jgi:hypothetical protein
MIKYKQSILNELLLGLSMRIYANQVVVQIAGECKGSQHPAAGHVGTWPQPRPC